MFGAHFDHISHEVPPPPNLGCRGGSKGGSREAGRGEGRGGGGEGRVCVWGGVGAYTQKALHTQGGVWPPHEPCYLGGGAGVGPCVKRSEPSIKRSEQGKERFGGAYTRRCIHKVVYTQGGAHTRQSVATAGVLLFEGGVGAGPRVERSELSVERSKPRLGWGGGGGGRGWGGGRFWIGFGLDPSAKTLPCQATPGHATTHAWRIPVASSGSQGHRGGATATFAIDG